MHLSFDNVKYYPHASSSVILSFFVADVKCGLCEINKKKKAYATHGPSLVQKMFLDLTKAMLD